MLSPSDRAQIVADVVAQLRANPRLSYLTLEPFEAEFLHGPLRIDYALREVRVNGDLVALQDREYSVLSMLARHVYRTLSREQLLSLCWPDPLAVTERAVDAVICRLRRKLGPAGAMIITSGGYGYRLFVADAL